MTTINSSGTPTPAPLDPDALSGVAQLIKEANLSAQSATSRVALAVRTDASGSTLRPTYEQCKAAVDATEAAASLLFKLGARLPQADSPARVAGSSSASAGFDLSLLASLDTPDTRRLLELLEAAQAVAERVDRGRGYALPDDIELQPGDSRGTDLADAVAHIARRVRGEVHGQIVGRE